MPNRRFDSPQAHRWNRRRFLKASATGALLLGASNAVPLIGRSLGEENGEESEEPDVVEIAMENFFFDPIGVRIEPGQTVRWLANTPRHTTTAYHPDISDHTLRIPEDAEPWNSEIVPVGEVHERTFEVEGVYDYYCVPHEQVGMVGRIIVGEPHDGPGTKPLEEGIPAQGVERMPSIEEIMEKGTVPFEYPE